MLKYLIICPLVFLAGFVDAIAGGGGLISLPAYMMTGIPVHNCMATNKMSSFMGTCVATYKYARNGFIPWKLAIFSIPCAIIGSSLGANVALLIPDEIFKVIMMVVLPATGLYVLFRKKLTSGKDPYPEKITILISMAVALCIGVYDGFYGPGTGTFLILLLTGLARMDLFRANGLTKAINFTSNLSALVVFLINGQALISLGVIAGMFNIAGNYLGASWFKNGADKITRPIILIVLVIFLIKLLAERF